MDADNFSEYSLLVKRFDLTLKYKVLSESCKLNGMKIPVKKFVIIFLISAFAFQFISNLILEPVNGDWFPGNDSPIPWKRNLAASIYPVKLVLVGPLSIVFNDPDPPPPIRVLACALYWTAIAFVLHFILSILFTSKKSKV